MNLGNNVFLGRPVYAKEDGSWKKKRKPMRRSSDKTNPIKEEMSLADEMNKSKMESTSSEVVVNSLNLKGKRDDEAVVIDSKEDSDETDKPSVEGKPFQEASYLTSTTAAVPEPGQQGIKDNMVMFHVVFVLRPPPLEYHVRVKDIYDNVVRKLTKALKWEQARSSYVAKEASLISSTAGKVLNASKDNPPLATLYHNILSQSSLAKAIATLYNNISNSKIAHLELTPTVSLSLQIPIPMSISVLPSPLSPQVPGLWLTTATSRPTNDDDQLTGSQLGSQFTLLLLSDINTILADVNAAATPISGPLSHYLRASKSTKSFSQISQASGIPLSEIQIFASHLIYWRRARMIPPLRQSDIYVVSPNANMNDLSSASSRFAKAFPILPSLPRLLSMLSSPKPYSTLIPNKDRKEIFMDILAWLLRGGWVTQLRTFAWVRVPPKLRAAVDGEFEHDSTEEKLDPPTSNDPLLEHTRLEVPSILATSPASSTHTAIPIDNDDDPVTGPGFIIPNPRTASALPSHYLAAISSHIGEKQGIGSQQAWEKCLKYFDGKHAIETIASREGWKRRRVTELVAAWEGLGLLCKTRHW